MFDIERFLNDYSIPYITEGDKHCTVGWIQIRCPFCDSIGEWHLGFNLENSYWNCWRCGWRSMMDVISALLDYEENEENKIRKIIRYYTRPSISTKRDIQTIWKKTIVQLPPRSGPLSFIHRRYLHSRGFDDQTIHEIIRIWNVRGTGPIGKWKFRLIIPVYFLGNLVSFTSRSISEENPIRYKSCNKKQEIVRLKNTLYGYDQAIQNFENNLVVVTEGIFDVWKLGCGAVATFGVNYSAAQLNLLTKFKNIAILFDNDKAGQEWADKLAADLSNLDKKSLIVSLDEQYKDAGEMPIKKARKLMEEIIEFFSKKP